jgi:hypothetical protein
MRVSANHYLFIAIFTCFKGMIGCKIIPMVLLVLCEHAGAVAKRANTSKGLNNGRAYKLRSIGYFFDGFQKIVIHFKGNYTLLFLHVGYPF